MSKGLLNILTVLSLLLCAASLAGWALSYEGPLSDPYGLGVGARRVALYRGALWLNHYLPDPHFSGPALDRDWGWNFLDAVVYRHFWGRREEWTMFGLRLLPVAGAASALPLLRLGAALSRRRRRAPGTCSEGRS